MHGHDLLHRLHCVEGYEAEAPGASGAPVAHDLSDAGEFPRERRGKNVEQWEFPWKNMWKEG